MKPLHLTLLGAPRTKKNHGRIVRCAGSPRMLPSAQYESWAKQVCAQLAGVRADIAEPVNCRALFFRDAARGDAVGYYQALADALEKAGIVKNDVWIVSWDGSRLLKDAARPRVELVLEPIGA